MTTTLTESRQTRANLWSNMTEIMDRATAENRPLTIDERTTYDALEVKLDELIETEQRETAHQARAARYETIDRDGVVASGPVDRDGDLSERYRNAFQSWVVNGTADMSSDERAALREGWVKPEKGDRAAAGVGTTTAGGYLVPEGFRAQIIERQKNYGRVEAVATVIRTATGATLLWPTNDDTGNVGALLAENTAATEQDFTFGMEDLGAYKYTSKIVRASIEFLQDVDWIDAESWIAGRFAERLGRIENQHFTTGTGTSQPQGIVTGATSGKTAASATLITADELIDLQHSVDPAYRESTRSRFMLSDTALSLVRKLKASGTGEYLFQNQTAGDVPALIAGSPYVVNNDMAVPATGVKSVLYGDFAAGYVIRKVLAMQMLQLRERYAEYGQVGFIAFERADAVVQDANAYKALTQA
jgi:HK97 family phage major capsid protein